VIVLLVLLVVVGPAPPAWAQEWRWPLDGPPAVSRPFAPPAHRYAAGHRGADLPSAPGAPVRAAGDGVVAYAGLVAGRGVVVVVHGDLRTTYEPVSAVVDVGAPVVAGEVVGVLEPGHLGCPALACLHWGLRRGEGYLDPVRLVAPGPVRLLPVEGAAPGPAAVAAAVGGGAERRVLAPAAVRSPAPAVSRPAADVRGGEVAAAALLGAAAVGAARRRRR
jgi:murein DD-endopeptidase MepM/ murein hydrolase activator NlpD